MEQIIRMLIQILLMFLAVVALHGKALGDIAPPPPDIPGTSIALPEPVLVLIGGAVLVAAFAWSGRIARQNGNGSRGRSCKVAAAVVACLSLLLTSYAFVEHRDYSQVRSNYRPLGPPSRGVDDEPIAPEAVAARNLVESPQ